METKKAYKKHQSFKGFSHNGRAPSNHLQIIKSLEKECKKLSYAQKAFDDLFSENKEGFSLHQNTLDELNHLDQKLWPRYLDYRYRYEIFPEKKILESMPPCIQIEPTSICNFRCVFCYQTDKTFSNTKSEHMGKMPLELFKKIIDEAEGKCESITLASRGEPLVHKDISKMLHYMGSKFIASKMNTNASLLNEKRCHDILSSGLNTLVFSIDAADKELYQSLRVNGNFEKTLKNVKMFNQIRENHYSNSKLITRVSGVKMNDNRQSFSEMEDFWKDYADQIAFVDYNPWENTYEAPPQHINTACTDLWRRMFIWYDGKANPCDVDYKSDLSVGSVIQHSISELWTSNAYQSLRKQHLNGNRSKLELCKRCSFE